MDMCFSCRKEGSIELSYAPHKYCEECFIEYLQQRILKDLRKHKVFSAKERLFFATDNPRTPHAKRLLAFLEKNDILIIDSPKGAKLCDAKSLDELGAGFLTSWFKGTTEGTALIYPIRCILDEELNILAELWKLPKIEPLEGKIAAFIKEVRKKHPQVPFSLLASIDKLSDEIRPTRRQRQDGGSSRT